MKQSGILSVIGIGLMWANVHVPAQAAVDPRCGSYCLYVALKALDADVPDFNEFDAALGAPPQAGYSLQELAEAAEKFGLHHLGVETSLDNLKLRKQKFACLALLREGHFVLVSDFDDRQVTLIDPPDTKTIPASTVSSVWDGKALLLSPVPLAAEADLKQPLVINWPMLLGGGALSVVVVILIRRLIRPRVQETTLAASIILLISGCNEHRSHAPDLEKAATLSLQKMDYDLGNVPITRERHIVRLPVLNSGTAPLEIFSVETTCGCAGLGEYRRLLAPGEKTEFTVGLDCSVPGRRSATVVVSSNSTDHGRVRIPVSWTPVGRFAANPATLELGVIRPESAIDRTVSLTVHQGLRFDEPPVIRKIDCIPENLVSCTSEPNGAGFLLAVRVEAPPKAADLHGEILVEMADADLPEIRIPVHARVSPPVYAEPESLFLGSGGPGDITRGRIIVCSSGNEPVKILKVGTDQLLPGLSISVAELTPSRIAISVSLRREESLGVQRDVLRIEVNSPVERTLEVPIIAVSKT